MFVVVLCLVVSLVVFWSFIFCMFDSCCYVFMGLMVLWCFYFVLYFCSCFLCCMVVLLRLFFVYVSWFCFFLLLLVVLCMFFATVRAPKLWTHSFSLARATVRASTSPVIHLLGTISRAPGRGCMLLFWTMNELLWEANFLEADSYYTTIFSIFWKYDYHYTTICWKIIKN